MTFSIALPWLLCASLLVCFVVVGLRSAQDVDQAENDFLTGGRTFSAVTIAMSVFATSLTGFMFVGAVGAGYANGVAALWVPLAWFFGEWLFWQVFPKRIHAQASKWDPLSIPDYISRAVPKPQQRSVRAVAGVIIVITILPFIVAQNVAIGKAFSSTTGSSPSLGVIVAGGFLTAIALAYCIKGGLRSSIRANAAQGFVILSISLIVGSYILWSFLSDPSIIGTMVQRNSDIFNPFAIHAPLLLFPFLLGAATASFGSAMSLPTVLMRISVARSEHELAKAKWIYLILCYSFWAMMVCVGTMLSGLVPNLTDPEEGLFVYAASISPVFLGLTLAGVSTLILSTIDGSTMVGGSALSDDLGDALNRNEHTRKRMRASGLVAFALIAFTLAIPLSTSSVYDLILFGMSALAGGVGPAFMIATLGWRTNKYALNSAIIIGASVAIIWGVLGLAEFVSEALPSVLAGFAAHCLFLRATTKVADCAKPKTPSS